MTSPITISGREVIVVANTMHRGLAVICLKRNRGNNETCGVAPWFKESNSAPKKPIDVKTRDG